VALGLVVDHGFGVLVLGAVVKPAVASGAVVHGFGARALEMFFFSIVLCFAVWVALSVQQNAQKGVQRWEKDKQGHSGRNESIKDLPLTQLWCRRDASFMRHAFAVSALGRCPSEGASWLWTWMTYPQEDTVWSTAQQQQVLQIWQTELADRSLQWRMRWVAADRSRINAAMAAETFADDETPAVDAPRSGSASVSLEQQMPAEILRLQARANERLTRWDTWAAELVKTHTQSFDAPIQPQALWSVAQSLEGVGSDVGARMVRQSLKVHEQATRAEYLQNTVTYLPWLLLCHWLFTVLATVWMRVRVAPLQQLNGLVVLGIIFWAGLCALGAAPSPAAQATWMWVAALWMVVSWVMVHFFPQKLPLASASEQVNASLIPGWWLFTAIGWLLLLDQSLHFHERLRFLALEQWWAWCASALLLPLAAWIAPWTSAGLLRLGHWVWGWRSVIGTVARLLTAGLVVAVFYLAHRQNIPQHVTGEVLKILVLVVLSGWCVWKMPMAAQLWHAGHVRTASRDLVSAVVFLVFVAAAAFLTSDKGPLLVIALLLAVLLATVLGWTAGMGMLVLGFALIFFIGVDLDVVGERLQAWRDPFTADRDDMARLMWFQAEAARVAWGFGVGQVPWCGTSSLEMCRGLPLQLQSDYTFTAIMGWWGPWGAWLWLLLFSAYVYRALVHCARVSPTLLTPLALLRPTVVNQALEVHLLFLFAVLVLMQTWITVAGNLGWLPLTGVTWPLMSYGKTSLWISTLFVGAWGMRRRHA
jgi:cell division protein FtsW (lipid II flippase)